MRDYFTKAQQYLAAHTKVRQWLWFVALVASGMLAMSLLVWVLRSVLNFLYGT